MQERADFTVETNEDGATSLLLSGPLRIANLGDLDKRLTDIGQPVSRVDLSAVSAIDTAGAWLAWRTARDLGVRLSGASPEAHRLIAAVAAAQASDGALSGNPGPLIRFVDWTGRKTNGAWQGMVKVIGFVGALLLATLSLIRHPTRFRGKALVHQMELVGVTSIGIIALMSFLIGITIAQQGAYQLRQFGAEVFTVNLTGKMALRELGIIMTAIMVAGRSGSAFAAQIGTMRLTEEVDAMRTIGVSPMEALVIPRVLAATLMMPLLGFFSAAIAIVGGAFISQLLLDLPFLAFLERIKEVVPIHDLWVGIIKAPVFGLIIGIAGCYHGMQVESDSEEVGIRTTMAVVTGIFMVIVLDAFFAIFFTSIGWG